MPVCLLIVRRTMGQVLEIAFFRFEIGIPLKAFKLDRVGKLQKSQETQT